MRTDCIFCRIVAGTAPASFVAQDDRAVAFMDLGQVNPGHVLVVPRVHVRDVYTLDEATAAALFRLTVRVARAVKVALHPDGMNLFQANERAGQQDVFHFHLHIMPRWAGDEVVIHWPHRRRSRPELDELSTRIQGALREGVS